MNVTYEAHRLALNNLEVIENSLRIVEQIQDKVFHQIDKYVEAHCKGRGWEGVFDYLNKDLYFAPSDWCGDDYGKFDIKYSLGVLGGIMIIISI